MFVFFCFIEGTERLRESKTAWKLETALPSSIKISTSSSTLGRLNFPESPLSCLSKVLENTICTTGEVRFSLLSFSLLFFANYCLSWLMCVLCRLPLSMVDHWSSFLLWKVLKTLLIMLFLVYYLCIRYTHVSTYVSSCLLSTGNRWKFCSFARY